MKWVLEKFRMATHFVAVFWVGNNSALKTFKSFDIIFWDFQKFQMATQFEAIFFEGKIP